MEVFEQEGTMAGNDCFPVAFSQFAPTLVGTQNEIWIKWLGMRHGGEKHKPEEWLKLIDVHRGQPAYQQ